MDEREELPNIVPEFSNARRAWFISDLHIGAGGVTDDAIAPRTDDKLREFVNYLNWHRPQPNTHDLVILGDFGDYWDQDPGSPYAQNIHQQHRRAFQALGRFRGDIYVIRGNHDDTITDELANFIGHPRTFVSDSYQNPTLRIYAEHGHQFDDNNREGVNSFGYRLINNVLRHWEERIPNIDNIRPLDNIEAFVERELPDPQARQQLMDDLVKFGKDEISWPWDAFVDEDKIRDRLKEKREDDLDKLADRIDDVYDERAGANYNPCIFIFGHTHLPEYYGEHYFDPPQRAGAGLTRNMAYINTGAWMPTLFLNADGSFVIPQPVQYMRPFATVMYPTHQDEIFAYLYSFNHWPSIPPGDASDPFDSAGLDRAYKNYGLRLDDDEDEFWDEMDL